MSETLAEVRYTLHLLIIWFELYELYEWVWREESDKAYLQCYNNLYEDQ